MTSKKITHLIFGDNSFEGATVVREGDNLDLAVEDLAKEWDYSSDEYKNIRIIVVADVLSVKVGRFSYESV